MLKKILFILFISSPALACDICGCGNGSSFFGILPQSHFQFAGLRYQQQNFMSHGSMPTMRTNENFRTIETWVKLYPLPKVQLIVLMPYRFNSQVINFSGQKLTLNGVGDITAMAHYNIKNSLFDSTVHNFDQILLVGGGIKLPTGKYRFEISDKTVSNPNFQLGTGSVDFLLNTIYTVKHKNLGMNADLSYKINTVNKDNYRFGNKARVALNVFSQIKIAKLMLMPNIGLIAEHYERDHQDGKENKNSGGRLTSFVAGSEFYYKKFTCGFSYQLPINQYISNGELKFQNNLATHFTFLF